MHAKAVFLHNVRSAHNVGSIFRTADAAGASRIYLTGYTPRPVDGFGRINKDIAKTALGAESMVPWEYTKHPAPLLARLKAEGWTVVGVEQDERAVPYRTFIQPGPCVFVLGNEVRGLSSQMRALCDLLLEIPMHGSKESLNVSVAAGIVLFHTAQ